MFTLTQKDFLPLTYPESLIEERISFIFGEKIKLEIIKNCLIKAYSKRADTTAYNLDTVPNTNFYHEFQASFSEELNKYGWTFEKNKNYPVCVSPDKKTMIIFGTGSEGTGQDTDVIPTLNKSRLGIMAVNTINKSFDFSKDHTVYMILFRPEDDAIYCEISIPDQIVQNKIDGWKERNLLPIIYISEPGPILPKNSKKTSTENTSTNVNDSVDFQITRNVV